MERFPYQYFLVSHKKGEELNYQSFRELGKTTALCKTEVVKVQIVAGNDNGDSMRAFVEVPFVEFDVDKLIRNRLKEHIRGKMNTSF